MSGAAVRPLNMEETSYFEVQTSQIRTGFLQRFLPQFFRSEQRSIIEAKVNKRQIGPDRHGYCSFTDLMNLRLC